MTGNQTSSPQTLPHIYRGRIDWWRVLRGVILLLSSTLGMAFLYSIWTFIQG
jgi:hypothetical protein